MEKTIQNEMFMSVAAVNSDINVPAYIYMSTTYIYIHLSIYLSIGVYIYSVYV